LLSAADGAFTKHDYASAVTYYQRVIDSTTADAELRQSAQIGLASTQEANGKIDDAINTYLAVGQLGDKSAYATFAYNSAAHLYEQRGDKDNERKSLTALASLDADSPFVKQAQYKLKQLNAAERPPLTVPVSVPTPAPAAATPAPAQK